MHAKAPGPDHASPCAPGWATVSFAVTDSSAPARMGYAGTRVPRGGSWRVACDAGQRHGGTADALPNTTRCFLRLGAASHALMDRDGIPRVRGVGAPFRRWSCTSLTMCASPHTPCSTNLRRFAAAMGWWSDDNEGKPHRRHDDVRPGGSAHGLRGSTSWSNVNRMPRPSCDGT